MRLTGGEARGRSLLALRGERIRPTSALMREALFNILPGVENIAFLDLFAGTGSVGLEALSRGARQVLFVEQDPAVVKILKKNIDRLGYAARAEVLPLDARRALDTLIGEPRLFDVIFLDPPYGEGHLAEVMAVLSRPAVGNLLLASWGLVVLQHSQKEDIPAPEGYGLWKRRNYGESCLTFLKFNV